MKSMAPCLKSWQTLQLFEENMAEMILYQFTGLNAKRLAAATPSCLEYLVLEPIYHAMRKANMERNRSKSPS